VTSRLIESGLARLYCSSISVLFIICNFGHCYAIINKIKQDHRKFLIHDFHYRMPVIFQEQVCM
jgi:hypothetical protein